MRLSKVVEKLLGCQVTYDGEGRPTYAFAFKIVTGKFTADELESLRIKLLRAAEKVQALQVLDLPEDFSC